MVAEHVREPVTTTQKSILIVEDEAVVARDMERIISGLGYSVAGIAYSGTQAICLARETKPSLVLMDIMLDGEMDGIETAELIRTELKIPIIYVTGYADTALLDRAKIAEPYGFVVKPFGARDLQSNIEMAIHKHETERLLCASEERWRMLAETMCEGMIVIDRMGIVTFVNETMCRILGRGRSELVGSLIQDLHMAWGSGPIDFKTLPGAACPGRFSTRISRPHGDYVDVLVSPRFLYDSHGDFDGSFAVLTDISDRLRAEEQLRTSLTEKETLLKEIHHRVKNNLQVISSLLNLQSEYIHDPSAQEMFRESQNRVRSISLIHKKLYQSTDIERVDFAEYIRDLVPHLFRSYGIDTRKVRLRLDLHSVSINLDRAIPCGLITNELLSNALKHAFSDGREGEIGIEIREEGKYCVLVFSDNGQGFPPDLMIEKTDTLGLQLVTSLIQQINGTMQLDTSKGVRFTITIPVVRNGE